MAVSSILSSIAGFMNPATGIAQSVGTLLAPFRPDKKRIDAANMDQVLTRAAIGIQEAVNRGEIDVEAGLAQLDSLRASVASLASSQDPNMQRAAAGANINITNVAADLQSRRNKQASAPLSGGLSGSPGMQSEQVRSAIRRALIGQGEGELDSSPLGTLMAPRRRPTEMLPELRDTVESISPSTFDGDFREKAKRSLMDYVGRTNTY